MKTTKLLSFKTSKLCGNSINSWRFSHLHFNNFGGFLAEIFNEIFIKLIFYHKKPGTLLIPLLLVLH